MRLPRMTTRRWMVAVAVVGAAVGGVRLKWRRDHFLARAQAYEQEAQLSSDEARGVHESVERMEREIGQPEGLPSESIEDQREFADYMDRWSAYHAAMASKYRQAARYPWLSVEPDPPEPE